MNCNCNFEDRYGECCRSSTDLCKKEVYPSPLPAQGEVKGNTVEEVLKRMPVIEDREFIEEMKTWGTVTMMNLEVRDKMECKHGNQYVKWIGGDDGENRCLACENANLRAELERARKLVEDFGPFYYRDMNRVLGLPENTDLNIQIKKVRDICAELETTKKALEVLKIALEVQTRLTEIDQKALVLACAEIADDRHTGEMGAKFYAEHFLKAAQEGK